MQKLLFGLILTLVGASPALASEVVVFCPGAVQSVVRNVANDYEHKSGNQIEYKFGTAGAVQKRVAAGADGDVVIGTDKGLAALVKAGKVIPGTIRDLGSMGVGVAVRRGAAKPDIHDVLSFKKAMLAATSIMYADPKKGGQSGIHIAKVFAQVGLDKEIASKLQLRDRGPEGLKEVAKGDIDIGLGQISEILANKDVELVGPFPAQIQGAVMFSAGIHAAANNRKSAEDFIAALTSAAAKGQFKAVGFDVK